MGLRQTASEPSISGALWRVPRRSGMAGKLSSKSFVERNGHDGKMDMRRSLALLQREVVSGARAVDDVEFWGVHGAEGFRRYLKHKYGSILAGWRALDWDQSGRLTFHEFCIACRRMGYHGHVKKLWGELDVNKSGTVSLMEIDKEAGLYAATFKVALMEEYGDMLTAWRKGIDTNGTGRIEEKEINACCQRLGLHALDSNKLFNMLRSGPKDRGMTLEQFDPDAWRRWTTSDFQGLTSKANVEFLEDVPGLGDMGSMPRDIQEHPVKDGARKWRAQLHERDRAKARQITGVNSMFRATTLDGFKRMLVSRCGSLLGAWRRALDLEGTGRLTFNEFTMAMDRLGFSGDLKGLWQELDGKAQGYILFRDLDEETDTLLSELKTKLTEKYGNLLIAWLKGIDVLGNGCVNDEQFARACKQAGFCGDAKQLFRIMMPEKGRNYMRLEDFDMKSHLAFSRGDMRMLVEAEAMGAGSTASRMKQSFHERQTDTFSSKVQRAWSAAEREEFSKVCRWQTPGHLIDTDEEFKELCIRKYGSIIAAWRNCLDRDANGKLTFNEFCQALRRLGYVGGLKALWQQFDANDKGYVTLRDLDPRADDLVSTFLRMLAQRYEDIDGAWKFGFHKDPHEAMDKAQLKEACDAIGYPYDPQELFQCLQPVPGRQLITIWDLDPLCNRKRERGHTPYISEPRISDSPPGRSRGGLQRAPPKARAETPTEHSTTKVSTLSLSASGDSSSILHGISLQQQLRRSLTKKYGSTVAAWRGALNPELQGSLAFGKFCLVLSDCCFHGNARSLWKELCGESRCVEFSDVDPDAAEMLNEFREQLLGRFGSLLHAWQSCLDVDRKGLVDEFVFCQRCEGLGVNKRRAKRLFRLLLAHQAQHSLTCGDLRALLIGVELERVAATWGEPIARAAGPGDGGCEAALPADVDALAREELGEGSGPGLPEASAVGAAGEEALTPVAGTEAGVHQVPWC